MINEKLNMSVKIHSKKQIKIIEEKLNLLGPNNKYKPLTLLNLRLITSVIIFFMIIYFNEWGYVLAPLLTIIYYYLFMMVVLDNKILKRGIKLENEAMYFFEVLTLSIESGRNLKSALELTSNSIDSELSKEFQRSLEEIKYGKSITEALDNLKKRIPSDTINNVIVNISQSNMFGNDILETLYNQIEYLREKRLLGMKEKISKIPIQISVISVLFFIPIIMLLILSPVIIEYILR